MNSIFEINDGGTHRFSAESFSEALRMHEEMIGVSELDDVYIKRLLPNKTLRVWDEETNKPIEQTCAEWAKEKGFVSTSEW